MKTASVRKEILWIAAAAAAAVAAFLLYAARPLPVSDLPADALEEFMSIPAPLRKTLAELYQPPIEREYFAKQILLLARPGGQGHNDPRALSDPNGFGLNMLGLPGLNPGGKRTDAWITDVAYRAFDTVDRNRDGALSGQELLIVRNLSKVADLRTNCPVPPLAPGDQAIGLAVTGGELFSTYSVAGQSTTTTVVPVNIGPGAGEYYIFAVSETPVIWQVTGDTRRVAKIIVIGPEDREKHVNAGVSGVDAGKIIFRSTHACQPNYAVNFYETSKTAIRQLLKRTIPVLGYINNNTPAFQLADKPAIEPLEKQATPPEGFDPATWSRFIMFSKGLRPLSGGTIVSATAVEPYNVLPGWAGLAQLVHDGVLVRDTVRPLVPHRIPNGDSPQVVSILEPGKFWIKKEILALPADLDFVDFMVPRAIRPPVASDRVCLISAETGLLVGGSPNFCKSNEYPAIKPGPVGACSFKDNPAYKEKIRQKYQEYKSLPPRAPAPHFKYDRIAGTDADDAFLIPSGQTTILTGKSGNDYYFLPLRGGLQEIVEQPAANETNTLVFTDVSKAESPKMVLERDGSALKIRVNAASAASITIRNWFEENGSRRKPVACFVFLPDFEMLSADEADHWARDIALRPPAPPEMHIITPDTPRKRVVKDMPSGTELEHISVYKSSNGGPPPPGMDGGSYGKIQVRVWPRPKPVLLMLGSYEPVHWVIVQTKGAQVAGVVLAGNYRQTAESNVAVPIYDVSGTFTPENIFMTVSDSDQMNKLFAVTGIQPALMHFQSEHEAASFEIR